MVRWSEECQQAFDAVSDIPSSEPVLIIPDVNAPFVVQTDASDYGIGAVLLQMRSGKLMPCRFASRKLLPREQNYSTIERETLAIVYAVSAFYKFLVFRHFELQCDHRPISFLKKGKFSLYCRFGQFTVINLFLCIAAPESATTKSQLTKRTQQALALREHLLYASAPISCASILLCSDVLQSMVLSSDVL
ncbi:Pol polyprotein [Plakobranchus ocellatus]|uniref:Pol polyprotein n=1 Tax=Plakobranchus ocellatus TaxID=259542 RepID=A0AAV3YTF0_9GAST|nr:Pol polyprotein [Plakobranchus ocellatus]